jgi:hypothetical protein
MKRSTLQFSLFLIYALGAFQVNGQTTLTLQPGPADGKDLRLCSVTGYSSASGTELPVDAWTYQGTAGKDHSFIDFDLSSIPAGSVITSAQLFLYGATDLPSGGHSILSGSNEWMIQRVTSGWNLTTTTWATSPSTTTLNQVSMPASTTSDQNFQADVTNLVQDMIDDQQNSFGFMMKLQTEVHYRRVNFASRNYANASKRPKLVVTYTSTAGIEEDAGPIVSIHPNPTSTGEIQIRLNDDSVAKVELYSLTGEKVYTGEIHGKDSSLDLRFLKKGIYHLKLYNNQGLSDRKIEIL